MRRTTEIGDIHYREPAAEMTPPGSKTDAWIRKLLEERLKLSGHENLVAPILGAI